MSLGAQQWRTGPPLQYARVAATATRLRDGRVLIAGGLNGLLPVPTAEIFNPAADRFTSTGAMVTPRFDAQALLLPSGDVLFAGGGCMACGADTDLPLEIYNPATGLFHDAALPPVPLGPYVVATLLANGQVLLNDGGTTIEIFNPARGTYTSVAPMLQPRGDFTQVLLHNGDVLVTGGAVSAHGGDIFTAESEIYDPHANSWRRVANMPQAAGNRLAVLLPDGDVLLAGGYDNEYWLLYPLLYDPAAGQGFAQMYDPASNSFSPAGVRPGPFDFGAAAVLADGRVLFAGGFEPGPPEAYSSATELFRDLPAPFTLAPSPPQGIQLAPVDSVEVRATSDTGWNQPITLRCQTPCHVSPPEILPGQSATITSPDVLYGSGTSEVSGASGGFSIWEPFTITFAQVRLLLSPYFTTLQTGQSFSGTIQVQTNGTIPGRAVVRPAQLHHHLLAPAGTSGGQRLGSLHPDHGEGRGQRYRQPRGQRAVGAAGNMPAALAVGCHPESAAASGAGAGRFRAGPGGLRRHRSSRGSAATPAAAAPAVASGDHAQRGILDHPHRQLRPVHHQYRFRFVREMSLLEP